MTTFVELDTAKLAAAKLWLTSTPTLPAVVVGNAPYLTTAVYSPITVATEDVDTVAVDELWRLYVNPSWLASADVPTVAAEITHATLHLLMDHAGRARSMHVGSREAAAWRDAADVGIAETMRLMGLPAVVDPADDARLRGNLSTEERFAILNRLKPPELDGNSHPDSDGDDGFSCGSAGDGLARSYELPADADVGRLDAVSADAIRKRIAIEWAGWREKHKPGVEPGDWARFVTATLDPIVPWQQVLASAVRRAIGWTSGLVDYSYSRPSRRQGAVRQVVLPGMRRPTPDAAIVVDTSGSVDDGLLAQALAEVQGALAACGTADSSVRVLATDTEAHTIQRVRRAQDVQLVGGGGTDMGVGIKVAASLRPRPDVIIVLTDGETPWPAAPPPACVVIIALLGRDRAELPWTPSWATRVECIA